MDEREKLGSVLLKRLLFWFLADLITIAVFVAIYIAVVSTPFPRSSLNLVLEKYVELRKMISRVGALPLPLLIFINNTVITLMGYVPFAGFALFANSLYWTARVLQLVSILTSCLSGVPRGLVDTALLISVVLMPHTYLEFFAYGVAMYQNAKVSYLVVKRRWGDVRKELRVYLLSIPIALSFLALGALVEAKLVSMFAPASALEKMPSIEELRKVLEKCLYGASVS